MTWNKKNDQYALSAGLRQSSERLQRWINRRTKPNEVCEIEIDLRVFNQFIARDRDRGGYDRKTLKSALAQLDEKTQGLILITKSYTWAVHKILVRPLAMVLEINSQNGDKPPKLKTGDPMFGDDHKKNSRELLLQNISKIDTLFQKLGMKYTPDCLHRIWRLAGKNFSDLKKAVEYMLSCHAKKVKQSRDLSDERKGIENPKGWLYQCLKYGWHINHDEIFLPCYDDGYIYTFVDSLMGKIPPAPK
jgi:hypothetical protein